MELNKNTLTSLLSLDDDVLRSKLLDIAEVTGMSREDATKMTSDMRRVRTLLMMVSDDDIRGFLSQIKK